MVLTEAQRVAPRIAHSEPRGMSLEDRIAELGLELPPVPQAVADYVTYTQIGQIIYTSGMLPWIDGDLKFAGKMGRELTVEDGYKAFRLSALNGISLLKSVVGELANIKRIHRLEGVANTTPDFIDTPSALNGASHLLSRCKGALPPATLLAMAMGLNVLAFCRSTRSITLPSNLTTSRQRTVAGHASPIF